LFERRVDAAMNNVFSPLKETNRSEALAAIGVHPPAYEKSKDDHLIEAGPSINENQRPNEGS
jgi:hypothetical protein